MTLDDPSYVAAVDAAIRAANRVMLQGFRTDLVLAMFDALHEVNMMRPESLEEVALENLAELQSRAATEVAS